MTMEDIHQSAIGRRNSDPEGSRFIVRQLCNAAASGSRERPQDVQVYRAAYQPA